MRDAVRGRDGHPATGLNGYPRAMPNPRVEPGEPPGGRPMLLVACVVLGVASRDASAADPVAAAVAPYVDVLSPMRPPGRKGSHKLEYQPLASGGRIDLLPSLAGPGYVESIFLACKYATTLNVYVGGGTAPSLSVPVPPFFAATYVDTQPAFASPWFSGNGGPNGIGVMTRLPIPFASSIRIEIVNGSGQPATIWSQVTYQAGVPDDWPNTRTLHASCGERSGVRPYATLVLADVEERRKGRLAGITWLYDGYPGRASPPTAPLEGNFRITVDGAETPAFESSGTEDFFGMSGYFDRFSAPAIAGDIGLTVKTPVTFAGYRMFIADPVLFASGLRVEWQNGTAGQAAFTGTSKVVWCVTYYTE